MSVVLALIGGAAVAGGEGAIPSDRQRQLVAQYAACVVKRMPRKAKAVVLSDRESAAAIARYDEVVSPDCMPLETDGSMTMRTWPILIRVALAQALLETEPALVLRPLATVPPLAHGTIEKGSEKNAATGIVMSRLGECVVRAAPAASGRLIRADVASPIEAAAFEAVKPALSSCLSAGETFAFSPELLRGAVALNYYRLAKTGVKK